MAHVAVPHSKGAHNWHTPRQCCANTNRARLAHRRCGCAQQLLVAGVPPLLHLIQDGLAGSCLKPGNKGCIPRSLWKRMAHWGRLGVSSTDAARHAPGRGWDTCIRSLDLCHLPPLDDFGLGALHLLPTHSNHGDACKALGMHNAQGVVGRCEVVGASIT